jgi:hypothetical protein
MFPIRMPFQRYSEIEVRAEVTFQKAGALLLYAGLVALINDGTITPHRSIRRSHVFGVQRNSDYFPLGKRVKIYLRVAAGGYEMQVGDEPPLRFADPDGPEGFSDARFIVDGGALIHSVQVKAKPAPETPRLLTPRKPFQFQVTIDFIDDLYCYGPYSPAHFDSMLDYFEKWGVKRIDWMAYDGMFENGNFARRHESPEYAEAVRKTFEWTGDPLDYLVKRGHERGMEVYAQWKPHETGYSFGEVYREESPEGKRPGMTRMVGGWSHGYPPMLWGRPDCMTSRRPGTTPDDVKGRRCRTIRLWHWKDEPIGIPPEAIRIWVSRDNLSYTLYDGPRRISESSQTRRRPVYDYNGLHSDGPAETGRALTIEGLETDARYIALTTPKGQGRCINDLFALAELLDEQGAAIPFTYGWDVEFMDAKWGMMDKAPDGYDLAGRSISFDHSKRTGVPAPWDLVETAFCFGTMDRLVAFGLGKNPFVGRMAEAACPETRAWWMSLVNRFIRQGVDGVDFRTGTHSQTFEWRAYGFNKVIADEYRRRYGVDILTEKFDAGKWLRLRGEYYRDFLKEAAAALHAAGRKCQVHVFNLDEVVPETGKPVLNTYYDWKAWLAEGFIDEISNKGMLPAGGYWRDICRAAEARKIPVYYVPWAGVIAFGAKAWPVIFERVFDVVRASGQSGLNLYESCCILKAVQGKDIVEEVPEARGFTEFMRDYRRRM